MRKLMVSFILACVLLSGVSAAFAAELVSNEPRDWYAWINRDGVRFVIQTAFKGDINDLADPMSNWATADIVVSAALAEMSGAGSLDVTSGTRFENAAYDSAGRVVFTFSLKPLLNTDGTVWTPARYPKGYTPTLNDLLLVRVHFLTQAEEWITQEFRPAPFVLGRLAPTETSGNSGGCSAGAFAPFAGVLMLPLLALYRRKQ